MNRSCRRASGMRPRAGCLAPQARARGRPRARQRIWEEVGYPEEGRHKAPCGVNPRRIGVRLGEEGWKMGTALGWFCGTPGGDPSGHSSNMVTVSRVSGALPSHQAQDTWFLGPDVEVAAAQLHAPWSVLTLGTQRRPAQPIHVPSYRAQRPAGASQHLCQHRCLPR